ncbi:O-antigen ligase family protein [Bacteroidales bacterium OttesenSCG-928-E04]|nr:O-antigen ligase family protein [Bacteroidales bacterium OttesenSCG-928-E04]
MAIFVISIPFSIPYFTPLLGVVLLGVWLSEGNFRARLQRIDTIPERIITIVGIALLFFYAVGFFYAPDMKTSAIALVKKIWFLIAPLIFFTADTNYFTEKRVKQLFFLYICSAFCMILVNLIISIFEYSATGSMMYFTYKWLSHFTHPSYCSMYSCTALMLSFYFTFIAPINNKKYYYFLLFTLPLFFSFILMLQSRAGILSATAVVLALGVFVCRRWRGRIFYIIAFILALLFSQKFITGYVLCLGLITGVVYLQKNHVKARVFLVFLIVSLSSYAVFDLLIGSKFDRFERGIAWEEDDNSSIGQRMYLWESSVEMIKKKPVFGTGTGSARETLCEMHRQADNEMMLEKRKNAHNQYLETMLDLGLMGLIPLLAFLFFPFYYACRYRSVVTLCFVIIVALNIGVESMFEYYIGSDFIAFFMAICCYFIFLMNPQKKQSHPSHVANQ